METEQSLRKEFSKRSWECMFPDRSDTPDIRAEKREKIEQLLQVCLMTRVSTSATVCYGNIYPILGRYNAGEKVRTREIAELGR